MHFCNSCVVGHNDRLPNLLNPAMRKPSHLTPALLAICTISGLSWADDAGLRSCRGIADSAARLTCYDAISIPSGTTRAAPSAPVAPEKASRTPVERFGIEHKALTAEQVEMIESRIPGRFEGWGPKSLIRLANGQVWQVVDDTARMMHLDNPKVVVRRGMLGAYFLDIEGDNRSPRVRRVQ